MVASGERPLKEETGVDKGDLGISVLGTSLRICSRTGAG